jgi:hypothetical protein
LLCAAVQPSPQLQQETGLTELQLVQQMGDIISSSPIRLACLKQAMSSIASLASWHGYAAAGDAAAAGDGFSGTGNESALADAAQVRSPP